MKNKLLVQHLDMAKKTKNKSRVCYTWKPSSAKAKLSSNRPFPNENVFPTFTWRNKIWITQNLVVRFLQNLTHTWKLVFKKNQTQ